MVLGRSEKGDGEKPPFARPQGHHDIVKGRDVLVTIRQIAEETGFSIATVSFVLNGKGDARSISPATQKAIRAAAQRLGYRPSLPARALRSGKNQQMRVIGLYFSADYRSSMMNRFTNGLWACPLCQKPDISLAIVPYQVGRLSQNRELKSLTRFHGVILCNMSDPDMQYLEASRPSMPAVLYNRTLKNYPSVVVDNAQIGRTAAEVFFRHRRRHAAVLTNTVEHTHSYLDTRTRAFLKACTARGMLTRPPCLCGNLYEDGYRGASALLESDSIDCLFCTSDTLAYGAMRAILDRGRRIPQDIEVLSAGNGDPQQAAYAWPSLSHILIPIEAMAQECFRLVMEQIDRRPEKPEQICLPTRYIPRESCGG